MATVHSSPSLESEDRSKFQLIKDSIYDSCVAGGPETKLYTQRDILDFGIIPNNSGETLMKVIQALTAERLLIVVSLPGGNLAWKWRSAEDAGRYRNLTQEQSMVYAMVDEAGADGIWSRTVKARLGMHDSVLKQALKFLESKGYIKDMKSVEHPNKKMYIKAGLRPSDRATGGPWYTDSDLDEAFISELTKVIFDYITQRSTYTSVHREHKEKQPKKGVLKGDKADAKGKKRAAEEISTDDARPTHASKKDVKKKTLVPLPAGFNNYPTVRQIAELISSHGITSNTTLSEGDVQQLVDVLVWDNLVEPLGNFLYFSQYNFKALIWPTLPPLTIG